jgi:ABC-type lipoprotein release transport system permease subunit
VLFGVNAPSAIWAGFASISPLDPVTLASAAVFLLTVAAIASAIPSARVMRIDPAGALRQD